MYHWVRCGRRFLEWRYFLSDFINDFNRVKQEMRDAINADGIIITEHRSGTHIINHYALKAAAPASKFYYSHANNVPHMFYVFLTLPNPIEAIKKKWVVVTREDALRRTISNVIADQTKAFTSLQPKKRESEYDFEKILLYLHKNYLETQTAKMYLSHYECPTLFTTYEELCADLNGTVGKILDFLGIEQVCDVSLEVSPFKKQADATTEEYIQRFLEDLRHASLDVELPAIYGDIF